MSDSSKNISKATTMELNRLSTSIISILITLSICLGTFAYKTGEYRAELDNLKNQAVQAGQRHEKSLLTIKTDLKFEIQKVEERKAEKDVVELIFIKINDMQQSNAVDHKALFDKLDRLIENKIQEK